MVYRYKGYYYCNECAEEIEGAENVSYNKFYVVIYCEQCGKHTKNRLKPNERDLLERNIKKMLVGKRSISRDFYVSPFYGIPTSLYPELTKETHDKYIKAQAIPLKGGKNFRKTVSIGIKIDDIHPGRDEFNDGVDFTSSKGFTLTTKKMGSRFSAKHFVLPKKEELGFLFSTSHERGYNLLRAIVEYNTKNRK